MRLHPDFLNGHALWFDCFLYPFSWVVLFLSLLFCSFLRNPFVECDKKKQLHTVPENQCCTANPERILSIVSFLSFGFYQRSSQSLSNALPSYPLQITYRLYIFVYPTLPSYPALSFVRRKPSPILTTVCPSSDFSDFHNTTPLSLRFLNSKLIINIVL